MLQIDHLNAGYGKLQILYDVTFDTQYPFTAILGPNGSGKSTLLKSIFGLTTIFSGSIHANDVDLVGLATDKISRAGIAYVPQRNNIFTAMTVHENLLLGVQSLGKQQAHHAIEESYELFPILQKRRNQRAGDLSGGERQMVAIFIAWLSRPKLMLLDEPSAGLAPKLTSEVFQSLLSLSQRGLQLVVVEQNARSILKWCDDVIILREGTPVFRGTAEECQADEETVRDYLGLGRRAIQ